MIIVKGLEWIMHRFGLSSSKNAVLSDQDMVGTVIEPFMHEHQESILKGKVHYHGEISANPLIISLAWILLRAQTMCIFQYTNY